MFASKEQNNVIKEINRHFMAMVTIDHFSKRAWVIDYAYKNPKELLCFINDATAGAGLEKIIFPVRKKHLAELKNGFFIEGWIDGFFNGTDGFFLTAYPVQKRSHSPVFGKHRQQIRQITGCRLKKPASLPTGVEIFTPGFKDIPALATVFKKSFSSYPSPVDQPEYLAGVLGKSALFMAIANNSQIISAAAAEVDYHSGSAELTNCATLLGNRGGGLMSNLIAGLEEECLSRGIYCLYSLARASSYGMNLVFHRLGYRYRGTLINNCHICGDYENMNIWAKYAC